MYINFNDYRDIHDGKAVLMAALQNPNFVADQDRWVLEDADEQDLIDFCTAMEGKSSPKILEELIFSGDYDYDSLGVETCAMIASMLLPRIRKLTLKDTHLSQEKLRPILDELEKEDSVLTHLHLGLIHPDKSPPEIARMLCVNTSLVSLRMQEDQYSRDGLVQIESALMNQRNTTLADLVIPTSYDEILPPERFIRYRSLGNNPSPQLLGAAICAMPSASDLYWILRKNPQIFASSFSGEIEQLRPPAKRAKLK